jgi:hypothetical protein
MTVALGQLFFGVSLLSLYIYIYLVEKRVTRLEEK